MLFSRTHLASVAYELPAQVVTSDDIEARLAPVYQALRMQPGQLFALTGIRQRRWWEPGQTMADAAARAAKKALAAARINAADLGMCLYAGVCRDNLEPATACAVADGLGVRGDAQVFDIANACLGQLNGMLQIAAAIEAGQIKAGLVCSCESSRQIMELTIDRLRRRPDMQAFKLALATLTGGSGAAAVVLTHESLGRGPHRLLGGVVRTDPRWHKLCRWGPDTGIPASAPMVMQTDAPGVLEHGVKLGLETYRAFLHEMNWDSSNYAQRAGPSPAPAVPDKTICHQVGAGHRAAALAAMEIPLERDFSTFEHYGNIGTVSLPMTLAMADEQRFLSPGDRVALMGIGSGLNCLILGAEW